MMNNNQIPPTPKEMRELTDDVNIEQIPTILAVIYDNIEKSASIGKSQLIFKVCSNVSKIIKEKIELLGYQVKLIKGWTSQFDDVLEISW